MDLDPQRMLTTREAAHRLGLSESVMEKWRVSGTGPVFSKLGRRVVYDPRDLEDFAQRARRRSTSAAQAA